MCVYMQVCPYIYIYISLWTHDITYLFLKTNLSTLLWICMGSAMTKTVHLRWSLRQILRSQLRGKWRVSLRFKMGGSESCIEGRFIMKWSLWESLINNGQSVYTGTWGFKSQHSQPEHFLSRNSSSRCDITSSPNIVAILTFSEGNTRKYK